MIARQKNLAGNSYIDIGLTAVSNGFKFATDRRSTTANKWDTLSFVLPAFAGAPVVDQGAKVNAFFSGEFEVSSYSIYIDQISRATKEPVEVVNLLPLWIWLYSLTGLLAISVVVLWLRTRK